MATREEERGLVVRADGGGGARRWRGKVVESMAVANGRTSSSDSSSGDEILVSGDGPIECGEKQMVAALMVLEIFRASYVVCMCFGDF
ncbi:hypothetical protein Scep_012841 [Stephania cephalantha]|uniref:Uncharacterized protein n=1 Tax=Stephania cephalantha TaxID=152367 RepID=A0AAP0P726_9MAGN